MHCRMQYYTVMHKGMRPIVDVVADIREFVEKKGWTPTEAARNLGVGQPTMSRLLSDHTRTRYSAPIGEICNKTGIELYLHETGGPAADELVDTLLTIWDGSPGHAVALKRVLLSLKGLKPSSTEE